MGVSKPFTTPLQNSIHYMMARYAEMVVRAGKPIEAFDALIAATALTAGAGLATRYCRVRRVRSHSHRPLGLAMTPFAPAARRIGLRKGHFAR